MTPEEQINLLQRISDLERRIGKLELARMETNVNKLEEKSSDMRNADQMREINEKLDRILKNFGIGGQ
jgi:hypothetical protein